MTERIRLRVEGLAEGRTLGGFCCALAGDDAIRQELEAWPGVAVIAVDDHHGYVVIERDAGSVPVEDLLDALDGIGFPATVPDPPEP